MAGGLAEQLGTDPVIVRLAFVVLSAAGGFGVVLYLIGWLAGSEREVEPSERRVAAGSAFRQVGAAGLVVAGLLVLLQAVGLWFGTGLALSVALAAFGSALIWTRSDEDGRARLTRMASRLPVAAVEGSSRIPRVRLVAGAVLVVAGMATFLALSNVLRAAGQVAVAIGVTAAGVALILGPWMLRSARQLGEERRQRIRSEERAELAAHLHDSVLQTLALIQRSTDSRQMAILARGQERELRGWLYGRAAARMARGDQPLSVVLDEFAGRIERMYAVPVDVVVVGDRPMDDKLRALAEAASEAIANAARHSGVQVVSVYAEVTEDEVRVYVRDQGRGFDPAAVPAGRHGIAESIRGRMERHGGSVSISSVIGEGTEVDLRMPGRGA